VAGFNSPDDADIILLSNLLVEWFGNDVGSGIKNYKLIIDDIISLHDASAISHVLDVVGLDGTYSLKIIAFDVAGNSAFELITIQISLVSPEFTTSLGSELICNDLNMDFILSLDDPHFGIKSISIIADNSNEVFSIDYGTSYQTDFYWLQINVTETDFLGGLDHNLTISVFDRANRETRATISIILDQIDPEFWRDPVFDSSYMSNEITDINLVENQNIHNISVTIFEVHTISSITLTIVGQGYNETFQMLFDSENSYGAVHQYYIEVDFTDLVAGDYSLIFDFVDVAGNSNSETYSIRLIPTVDPSGFRFIYIIVGVAIAIIISFVLSISLRKTVQNIGWRKELVVVAYVLRSGLTSLFVPYSPEFVTDEQLFGGAMTGIRSILEEIIGGKDKFEVQIVEFGEKHMLIYSGLFGDCVLLVRSIKPMHTRVLTNFTDQFERDFTSVLEDDTHVTLSDYMGAESLVEDYFGKREPLDAVAYQLYKAEREQFASTISQEPVESGKETLVSTFYHEIISQKSDAFLKLPGNVKVLLGDAISFAEESLTDLISEEFKTADKKASVSLKSLDLARQQIEKITDFAEIFETIPKIAGLVIQGAASGRRGNTVDLHKAIEMASQLFLAQIT